MNFSAAQLVKNSAKSICYLRNHPKERNRSTPGALKGNELASKKIKGFQEMGCKYEWKDHVVHLSYDEVRLSSKFIDLIEHKSIQYGPAPDWYFKQSLIQVAFYHALGISYPRRDLETSKFFRKFGWKTIKYEPTRKTRSYLFFGDTKYRVKIKKGSRQKILNFFLTKAEASLGYDTAKNFDLKYKHKEWEVLGKFIKYEVVGYQQ